MKPSKRLVLLLILCFSILFPWLVFQLQDFFTLHQQVAWTSTSNTKELMKQYPLLSSVYANFYELQEDGDDAEVYDLTHTENYGKDQAALDQIKADFSKEINQLIKFQVLPTTFFDHPEEDFQVRFGTLSNFHKEESTAYYLNQVFTLNGQETTSASYTLDRKTKKLLAFSFYTQQIQALEQEDQKAMAWQMIQYLGLDKIEDWTYTDYGYESYQARVQIYCTIEKDNNLFTMGITPLGQQFSSFSILKN